MHVNVLVIFDKQCWCHVGSQLDAQYKTYILKQDQWNKLKCENPEEMIKKERSLKD